MPQEYEGIIFDWEGTLHDPVCCPGKSELYAGVKETLEALKAKGYQLAIATSASRRSLDYCLEKEGLENLFACTFTGSDEHRKPDPALSEDIVLKLGVEKAKLLMIGDSPMDMHFAKLSGIDCVAVNYGISNINDLNECSPNYTITSVQGLLDIL